MDHSWVSLTSSDAYIELVRVADPDLSAFIAPLSILATAITLPIKAAAGRRSAAEVFT